MSAGTTQRPADAGVLARFGAILGERFGGLLLAFVLGWVAPFFVLLTIVMAALPRESDSIVVALGAPMLLVQAAAQTWATRVAMRGAAPAPNGWLVCGVTLVAQAAIAVCVALCLFAAVVVYALADLAMTGAERELEGAPPMIAAGIGGAIGALVAFAVFGPATALANASARPLTALFGVLRLPGKARRLPWAALTVAAVCVVLGPMIFLTNATSETAQGLVALAFIPATGVLIVFSAALWAAVYARATGAAAPTGDAIIADVFA